MIELSDVTDVDQAIARCRECLGEHWSAECDREMRERIDRLEELQQRRDDA